MPSAASQTNHLSPSMHLPGRNRSDADAKTHNSPFAALLNDSAPQPEPKSEAKSEAKSEIKSEPKSQAKSEPKSETKSEAKSETKSEANPEAKSETQPEANPTAASDKAAPSQTERSDPTSAGERSEDALKAQSQIDTATDRPAEAATDDANAPSAKDGKVVVVAKVLKAADGDAAPEAEAMPDADTGSEPEQDTAADQAAPMPNVVLPEALKPVAPTAILPSLPVASAGTVPAQASEAAAANPLAPVQDTGLPATTNGPKAASAPGKPEAAEEGNSVAHAKDGEPAPRADKFQALLGGNEAASKADVMPPPQNHGIVRSDMAQAPTQAPIQVQAQVASTPMTAAAGNGVNPPFAAAVPLSGLPVEIAAQAIAGKHRFEIRLDPPELGRIDVRLDVGSDGQVSTRLVVDRAETLDLLKRDAADLQRALQQAGLKTSDNAMEFSLRQQAFGRDDTAPQAAARIVVPDDDTAPLEAVRQGYGRLLGLGGGLDIRV